MVARAKAINPSALLPTPISVYVHRDIPASIVNSALLRLPVPQTHARTLEDVPPHTQGVVRVQAPTIVHVPKGMPDKIANHKRLTSHSRCIRGCNRSNSVRRARVKTVVPVAIISSRMSRAFARLGFLANGAKTRMHILCLLAQPSLRPA